MDRKLDKIGFKGLYNESPELFNLSSDYPHDSEDELLFFVHKKQIIVMRALATTDETGYIDNLGEYNLDTVSDNIVKLKKDLITVQEFVNYLETINE